MKEYIEPTIATSRLKHQDTTETHPAYGKICLSVVSSSHPGVCLYGSDFTHSRFIQIRVYRSELDRGLNKDWVHQREQLLELSMSQSQWARFVSSANDGSGVQCTLEWIAGEGEVPGIVAPTDRTSQFHDELREKFKDVRSRLDDLSKKIDEAKLSEKAKKEFQSKLDGIRMDLGPNVKFVEEQFGEHLEKLKEEAKTEIHAYIVQSVSRADLAIQGSPIDMPVLESK